jgi:anti-anti-sigma factor
VLDQVAVMAEDTCPVQWINRQAVVTLPEHIDRSNADRIREQLLLVINRGAAALIADLAATASCDYSGADALARAYQRAAASGTELRIVVTADVVRRVLSLSGLDRLISAYPTLDAALAAGAARREIPAEPATPAISPAGPEPADLARPAAADPANRTSELLDWVLTSIDNVAVSLQAAVGLPRDITAQRIAEALRRLDDVARVIRLHELTERGRGTRPGPARRCPPDIQERSALGKRTALLHQRVAQTAQALQFAAADTAALLQQRADILGQPGRIDYPTEIKQWRVLADQAGQLAQRWEQRP